MRSILPVVVGTGHLGEALDDVVLPTDPLEEHLGAELGLDQSTGELGAVVGLSTSSGTP